MSNFKKQNLFKSVTDYFQNNLSEYIEIDGIDNYNEFSNKLHFEVTSGPNDSIRIASPLLKNIPQEKI